MKMGCPAIETRTALRKTGRAEVWAFIRAAAGEFTVYDVMRATKVERETARQYMHKLNGAGILSSRSDVPPRRGRSTLFYRLETDLGERPPTILADGSISDFRPGEIQAAIWTAIRIVRRFEMSDLVVSVRSSRFKTTPESIRVYVSKLVLSGYIRRSRSGFRNTMPSVFTLIRDTGPLAPAMKNDGTVWDRNRECLIEADDE